jgi:hypothetical protein
MRYFIGEKPWFCKENEVENGMENALTGTALLMQLDTSDQSRFRLLVRAAVARAMTNQDGHWRTDDKRDARDVAEVACHFLMDEIKSALQNAERAQEFAKNLDVNVYRT